MNLDFAVNVSYLETASIRNATLYIWYDDETEFTTNFTIAESFARRGVGFLPGSNRRIDGWNLMHQYLAWDTHEEPLLKYFNVCYNI